MTFDLPCLLLSALCFFLQLNFWYNNALISRDIYDELAKCDLSLGALWRTDGASGFTPECEALRNRAYKQIGEIDQVCCVGR